MKRYYVLYGIAFLWHYLIWAISNYLVAPDTQVYLELGRGIFEDFTLGLIGEDGKWYSNAFRMPLVPFMLGLLHLITRDTEYTYFLYSLFQTALTPMLPCIAFYWGSRLHIAVGISSYVFLLFHVNVLYMQLFVLTDIPFAVFSNICFVMLWQSMARQDAKWSFSNGIVAGLACLIRPIMKLYPAVCVCMLIIGVNRTSIAKRMLAFLCGFLLILSPWIIRNFLKYRTFVLETNQGLNLLWSNAHLVEASVDDDPKTKQIKNYIMQHTTSPGVLTNYRGRQFWVENDLLVSQELQKIALEAYKNNPGEVIRTWTTNFSNMTLYQGHYDEFYTLMSTRPFYKFVREHFFWPPNVFDRRSYHLILEMRRAVLVSYTYVAWVGLVFLVYKQWRLGVFVGIHIFYFTGLTAFVAGYDRYRLNLETFYAMLVTYCIIAPICCLWRRLSLLRKIKL